MTPKTDAKVTAKIQTDSLVTKENTQAAIGLIDLMSARQVEVAERAHAAWSKSHPDAVGDGLLDGLDNNAIDGMAEAERDTLAQALANSERDGGQEERERAAKVVDAQADIYREVPVANLMLRDLAIAIRALEDKP